MIFDFHIHSTYSDGSSTLEEIFKKAKTHNAKALAITDHDTILGLEETHSLSKKYNIPYIPGAEFTAVEDGVKFHVLAYNIDIYSKELRDYSQNLLNYLNEKSVKQIKMLQDKGYDISKGEFFTQSQGGPLYRAKLLRTISDKGYIRKDEIMTSIKKFFNKEDGICYIEDTYKYLDFNSVCSMIKRNKGCVVLAHPGKIKKKNEKLYNELINSDLIDGLEIYHPSNNEEVKLELKDIVNKKKLLVTGGTDYHGIYRKNIIPLFTQQMPEYIYYNLEQYLKNKVE